MRQAILVFEWERPRYLQVCLDSLARVSGIEDWPILVSIDGPVLPGFQPLASRCAEFTGWPSHVGNLWHVTRSLTWACELGYERILFMDGDVILRTDTLQALPEKQPADLLICMRGSMAADRRHNWFAPQANLILQQEAIPLLKYVTSMGWVGKPRPGTQVVMTSGYPGYDAVYLTYMLERGLVALYRDRSYAGHIGVCGVDSHHADIEAEMFSGPPEGWLSNAIRLFDPARSDSFTPPDFVYA